MNGAPQELENLKVLLVDDATEIRTFVKRALERFGAQVESAENGLDGVTKAIQDDPDVVLMDLQMPVVDGKVATQQLRKCGYDGLIMACSGTNPQHEGESLKEAGFDDYVSKPVDLLSLVNRLRRFQHLKLVRELTKKI